MSVVDFILHAHNSLSNRLTFFSAVLAFRPGPGAKLSENYSEMGKLITQTYFHIHQH